ncbi:peptide-methionine (S)-S-oxide reductase MsrA [Pirellulaceae bacterium SH449]
MTSMRLGNLNLRECGIVRPRSSCSSGFPAILGYCIFALTLLGLIFPVRGGPAEIGVQTTNDDMGSQKKDLETITLGGGCFWCVEAVFQRLDGVMSVVSGYTGGTLPNPTYETIKFGGHAEVVQVSFDPSVVSLEQVFIVFLKTHDPTSWHKQGPDIGPQYRSAIFYHTEEQKEVAEKIIKKFTEERVYRKPIVTEITQLGVFYRAEEYHQNYYNRNRNQQYCYTVVRDKVNKFERLFKEYSVTNKKKQPDKKQDAKKNEEANKEIDSRGK